MNSINITGVSFINKISEKFKFLHLLYICRFNPWDFDIVHINKKALKSAIKRYTIHVLVL